MKFELFKIKKIVLTIVLLFIAISISAYAGEKKDTTSTIDFDKAFNTEIGNTVLAQVGDKKITIREFISGYEFGPAFVKREKDSKKQYLKYMINEKLLALDGYKRGFADSAKVKNLLSAINGDLATTELFKEDILNKIKISQPELNKAIDEKQYTYQILWLFAPQKDSLEYYLSKLKNGVSFDSLFNMQLVDSVYADQRTMDINKFKLRMQNFKMYQTVDSMKVGEISGPVQGSDGWYIIKLKNITKNVIVTQTELNKEDVDATSALKLNKSDQVSDTYVKTLMLEHNPVIQARAFDILRSYMGEFVLTKDKFKAWGLDNRMQKELDHFDTLNTNQFGDLNLVVLSDKIFSLDDFLNWYKMRDGALKFNKTDFNSFSASLEKLIWQMIRDNLLIQRAYALGFQNDELVKQQTDWWEDKIIYAVVRDEMANSIGLNIEDPASLKSKNDNKKQDLIEKTFRKLQLLRKKYKVSINENILKKIKVQDYNSPQTIDTYIVKKGGTFPHPAFPSIDYSWQVLE